MSSRIKIPKKSEAPSSEESLLPPSWLTTKEAARRGALSESYLEKLRINGGGAPFLKIGRLVRYGTQAFDTWLSSHTVAFSIRPCEHDARCGERPSVVVGIAAFGAKAAQLDQSKIDAILRSDCPLVVREQPGTGLEPIRASVERVLSRASKKGRV